MWILHQISQLSLDTFLSRSDLVEVYVWFLLVDTEVDEHSGHFGRLLAWQSGLSVEEKSEFFGASEIPQSYAGGLFPLVVASGVC